MRNLYKEFFLVPKQGNVRDKVMLVRTAIMLAIMIVCLVAISFSAYAYFSHTVTSSANIIQSAYFKAGVTIGVNDPDETSPAVKEIDNITYEVELKAGPSYIVTLTPGDSTAKTGFCTIIAAGCLETYDTQQLGVDMAVAKEETPQITFTLTVSKTTTVQILSCWGTSSYYDDFMNAGDHEDQYITSGEIIHIDVDGEPLVSTTETEENTDTTTTEEVTDTTITTTAVTTTTQTTTSAQTTERETTTTTSVPTTTSTGTTTPSQPETEGADIAETPAGEAAE